MKKVRLALSIMCLTGFSWLFASQAQAAIISQDIYVGAVPVLIGEVTVELDNSYIGTGLKDVEWDDEFSLVSLSLFGSSAIEIFLFEAQIDSGNIAAGLEFLSFDAADTVFVDNWHYQFLFDAFDPSFGQWYDIFDGNFELLAFGDEVFLGEARLSDVPLPSTLSMMGLVLLSLVARRRIAK